MVRVECLTVGSGTLEVLRAEWKGMTVHGLARLKPGDQTDVKDLRPVVEWEGGDCLLLRVTGDQAPVYRITNNEKNSAFVHTVTPPTVPWWKGTTFVRWPYGTPYVLEPGQEMTTFLMPKWQDILYFWVLR